MIFFLIMKLKRPCACFLCRLCCRRYRRIHAALPSRSKESSMGWPRLLFARLLSKEFSRLLGNRWASSSTRPTTSGIPAEQSQYRNLSRWCTWLGEVFWGTWQWRWVLQICDWWVLYRLLSKNLSFSWCQWSTVFWARRYFCLRGSNRDRPLGDFWFYLKNQLLPIPRWTFLRWSWWRRDGTIWNVDFWFLLWGGRCFLWWV